VTSSVRVGIDIGGTFTDVVLLDDASGEVRITKLPSTPSNPRSVSSKASIGHWRPRASIPMGCATWCTDDRRHQCHHRGEGRPHRAPGDARLSRHPGDRSPDPSRSFRSLRGQAHAAGSRATGSYEIGSDWTGRRGLRALDEADIARAAEESRPKDRGGAVCFLHSYAFPEHERQAAEMLRKRLPGVAISLSSEVLPQFGEYLRTSTTVVNAACFPS